MKLGEFDVHVLRQCTFRLDGGAMFGHVPKVVWSKLLAPDEQNRIPLACNVLLVRTPRHTVLVDTGMGTKWTEAQAALYDLTAASFDDLLRPHGLTPADVTLVALTHLHIDHAGGLTTRALDGSLGLVFPNAEVVVQKGEWDAAMHPDIRSSPSYVRDDFMPVHDAGKFRLLEGDGEIVPGIRARLTAGHTKWHQSIEVRSEGQRLVFLGDIMPTVSHIKPNYAMGYDLYPLEVIATRQKLIAEYADTDALLLFEHEPFDCFGRLTGGGAKPRFTPLPID